MLITPLRTTTSASTRKALLNNRALDPLPLPPPRLLLLKHRTAVTTRLTHPAKLHSSNRQRHRQASLSRTSTSSLTGTNTLTLTHIIQAHTTLVICISNLVLRTAKLGMVAALMERGRCTDSPTSMACHLKDLMIMPRPLLLRVLASHL